MMIDTGATAWVLAATALVMIMTPGVGFFYGGLVRKKNVINMIALAFLAFALISIQWILLGYSLAFGPDVGGIIGSLSNIGLSGIGVNPAVIAGTEYPIPGLLYVMFQLVFATVTIAIVTSGLAERVKLSGFIILALLWTTIVYDPLAHWFWGGGWLGTLGCLDFAGGAVIHISSGFAALAIAIVIGKRSGFGEYSIEPGNIPMALLGAALLWFGYFGFNAGSALAANGVAANALLVTNTAGATGAIVWMIVSWINGKPASLGIVSGAIAGLVAVTLAAGYVTPLSAMVIGGVGGGLCYMMMMFRIKKGFDESLDAWAIHGMGGLWGVIATGIFASAAVGGKNGLIYGNVQQFIVNCTGAFATVIYAFVITLVIAFIVQKTIGLRASENEEYIGLDLSQHGERV